MSTAPDDAARAMISESTLAFGPLTLWLCKRRAEPVAELYFGISPSESLQCRADSSFFFGREMDAGKLISETALCRMAPPRRRRQ